ncbi:MAG: V-type ATPase 116kDa subunit family protein [Asgard group archaeon]|nr:V-type ATPase 116kDa subunit family protein [Asgard group archaeon]
MSLLPDRMKMVKCTVPLKFERNVLRYLIATEDLELIDVQKKPFDLFSYEHGETIRELLNKYEKVIDHYDIDKKVRKGKAYTIDDSDFVKVLSHAKKLAENEILTLSQNIDRLHLAEQEIKKNKSMIEIAKNLIPFGFTFEDLDDKSTYFNIVVGRIKSKRISRFKWNLDAITDGNYILKESSADEGYSFIAMGYLEQFQEEINQLLMAYGFERYSVPERLTGSPEKVVEKSTQKIKNLKDRIKQLQNESEEIIKNQGLEILAYREQLQIEKKYLEIANILRYSKNKISLWGWVSKKDQKKVKWILNDLSNQEATVEFSEPVFEESEYPTKTTVPKIARVYDGLVNAYGTPGYNELNPAMIIFVVYPIIFGIMFADVGHGLLFTLAGVYGLTLRNKQLDTSDFGGEIKSYLKNGSMLIIISGIVSVVWGALFGSYFGIHHTHDVQWVPKAIWFNPESHEGFVPYNPQASVVILMLELSILVAMIHMTIGYILRFISNIKHKHYKEAIFVPVMLTIFHWSLFILVFTFGVDFMQWFQWNNSNTFDLAILSFKGEPIQFFTINHALLFLIIGFVAPLLVMSGYLITEGWDGIAELIELILSTLSNTVSYARIFAMHSVHGALSQVFLLQDFTGEGIGVVNIIGALIGSIVIVIIEGLFSFIQTLRLQWVEFFGKMGYHGTGRQFQAMVLARKYSKPVPPA